MVPYQNLVSSLGGQAQWDSKARKVTITKGKTTLELTANSRNATLNGKSVSLAVDPVMSNNQLLVPVRFVSESLGQSVHWNGATRTITLRDRAVAAKQPATTPATTAKKTGGVVNLYTSRHYGVEPVFTEFTKQTGITVRFTTGSDAALRERIKAEGKNSRPIFI